MNAKQAAAEKATEYIRDGMIIGLGTGSTAYWAIQDIGKKVKNGLRIQAVATSIQSEHLARGLGIPLVDISITDRIDVAIDGADEVDDEWNAIKGGGGALLREKIVASHSKELIVIVDESKRVNSLGAFALPVEVVIYGHEVTQKRLRALGCLPQLRLADNRPFVTDNGNYVIDCDFGRIEQPGELADQINRLPGVVDHGLFIQMATKVIVGYHDGTVLEL
jgi:ribose 5-phosphate isomerase A